MINDRDFIFDNFEEEEKDLVNSIKEDDRIFPSVDLDKLTDEQFNKLCSVINNGINKIVTDLAKIDDDDDIPFW